MLQKINKYISPELKEKVPFDIKLFIKRGFTNEIELPYSKDEPKIIVALAADYGNLGDVAITKAQISFLNKVFPNYKIVPIFVGDIYKMILPLKQIINERDIITIIGGGNMMDRYEVLEDYRRNIIKKFPDNKIVSFPQTIDFSQSPKGQKSLRKTIKAYSNHKDLHIFAREPLSYKIMKETFKENHVYMVPDIVFSIDRTNSDNDREGILICMRNDTEKVISSENKRELLASINKLYNKVTFCDTISENYTKERADQELEMVWASFKKAKVVITDRLHGMIFCAITQTPCVVLPNSNHKIASTYKKWVSDLDYISFVEDFSQELILDSIKTLNNYDFKNAKKINLIDKYKPLVDVLENREA